MGCAEIQQNLGAFVIGGLEAEELDEVERHLVHCPKCETELQELKEMRNALDTVPPLPLGPPLRLKKDIISRIGTESRHQKRGSQQQRLPLFAASAAAVLVLAFLGILFTQRQNQPLPVAVAQLNPVASYASALQRSGYWGVAEFYPESPGNQPMRLQLNNLRNPAPGRELYQVWLVSGKRRMSAGTFDTGASGRIDVWLNVPQEAEGYQRVLVTLKPAGRDPNAKGEVVLQGTRH